jgi:hypothetical protein
MGAVWASGAGNASKKGGAGWPGSGIRFRVGMASCPRVGATMLTLV